MNYVVILKRGQKLPDRTYTDTSLTRAFQRIRALMDLHGVKQYSVAAEPTRQIYTVDASAHYDRRAK